MASGELAQGKEVRAFEDEMAALLGVRGGVATSSGTSALHLALLVLGVGPADEVLIPSYTCVALLHAVHFVGAQARLVDSEPGGVNMFVDDAARQISPRTKAIVLPHMFGAVVAVEEFRRFGIPIIENCAQALGARRQGRPVGAFGDISVLSFYATKMITTGEGGMLLSRSQGLLDEARDLRDYDKRSDYRLRFNYKMTEVQAALGRSQLRKLPRFLEQRQSIAWSYHMALHGMARVYTPVRDGDACYRYVLAVPDVEGLIQGLAGYGIECKRPVYLPLHELVQTQACPHAAHVFRRAVSLPLYPSLTEGELALIGKLAAQVLEKQKTRAGAIGVRTP